MDNDWTGDAPALAQQVIFVPPGLPSRVDFKIGNRYLGFNQEWRRDDGGVSTAAIVTAWNSSRLGQFAEISAAATTARVSGQLEPVPALRLTAKTAGYPFEVSAEIDGQTYTSEVQKIALVNSPTGGTWTITFAGQTTSTLSPDASASAVQAALEALSNVAPGDVIVTKAVEPWPNGASYPVWTLKFAGAYADQNVPELTVDASGLTGGNLLIDVTSIVNGAAPVNAKQRLSAIGTPTGGSFLVTIPGLPTATIPFNATSSTAQTAFDTAIGAGKVTVTGGAFPGTALDVEFVGVLGGQVRPLMTVDASGLTGGSSSLSVANTTAGVAGTNAKYRLALVANVLAPSGSVGNPSVADSAGRTGFKWGLIVQLGGGLDWYSDLIDYTATNAEIKAALQDLRLFYQGAYGTPAFPGADGITVTGSLNNTWSTGFLELEFSGQWASRPITILVREPSGSEAAYNAQNRNVDVARTVVSAGLAGTNKVQTLTQSGSPTGNFRLRFAGQTTGPIPYGSTATVIAQALAQLSTAGVSGAPSEATRPNAYRTAPEINPYTTNWADNIVVGGGALGSAGVTLTYAGGGLQSSNSPTIEIIEGDVAVTEMVTGFGGVAEQQRVQLRSGYLTAPRGGTWSITYSGQTTAGISHTASSTEVRTALEDLSNLNAADVVVSGASLLSGFLVTFRAALGNVSLMSANGSGLANGLIYVRTDPEGGQRIEQRFIQESRGPWHGDDPLNWALNHVPDSGERQLLQLGTTGPRFGITWLSTFTVSPADSTHLICRNDLRTNQKVYVDSSGTLPSGLAEDTAYYVIRYDVETIQLAATRGGSPISLSGGSGTHRVYVRCAGWKSMTSWSGWAGTPSINPEGRYREYRPLYLSQGYENGARITVGEGDAGPGSPLTRLRMHDFDVRPEVLSTAAAKEPTLPACLLLGTHPELHVELIGGDLGLALMANETSTVKVLTIRGGSCNLGEGVTLPTGAVIDQTGGDPLQSLATIDGKLKLRK